jgi:hypothetical protein
VTTADSFYVLDAADRITHVSGTLRATIGSFLGHSFWEASPQAEPLFGPHFEEARRTGREVEFTEFYAGYVSRRRVVPSGNALTVFVTPIREVDVTTLATLAESLQAVETEIAARAPERPDRRAPSFLRALP